MSDDLLAEARRLLDAGGPRSARELVEKAREAGRTSPLPRVGADAVIAAARKAET